MASQPPDPLFRPAALVRALHRRKVRAVVVGAFAAQLRGMGDLATYDLDLTPDLDGENLQRLAETLHELGATVRIEPHTLGPVALPPDGVLIARAPILNLHLPGIGDVDVIHQAAGASTERGPLDYGHLARGATEVTLPSSKASILVMSEEDWIDAKRSPPVREKDVRHIAAYERWRDAREG